MDDATMARHVANRADLETARLALLDRWKTEDSERDVSRAAQLESFAQGLRDLCAVMGVPAEEPAVTPVEPMADPVV